MLSQCSEFMVAEFSSVIHHNGPSHYNGFRLALFPGYPLEFRSGGGGGGGGGGVGLGGKFHLFFFSCYYQFFLFHSPIFLNYAGIDSENPHQIHTRFNLIPSDNVTVTVHQLHQTIRSRVVLYFYLI